MRGIMKMLLKFGREEHSEGCDPERKDRDRRELEEREREAERRISRLEGALDILRRDREDG